ncbi:MAG TPA: hypothetical protein VF084_02390 [Nitrososphaeraceae archaeon]|jgi:hypothetical protein
MSEKMEHMKVRPAIDENWNKVLHNLQRETLAASAINNKLIISLIIKQTITPGEAKVQ